MDHRLLTRPMAAPTNLTTRKRLSPSWCARSSSSGNGRVKLSDQWTSEKPLWLKSECPFQTRTTLIRTTHQTAMTSRDPEGRLPCRGSRHKKRQFTFNPSGIWLYRWLAVVSLTVVFNTYAIILRTTFTEMNESVLWLWMTLDYVADAIYLIDILVQFRTSYLENGLLVTASKQMAYHYMKGVAFKLDVISLIPSDFLYLVPHVGVNAVVVRTNYPNIFRVTTLVACIMMSIHWNACFYFLISRQVGLGQDSWVYPSPLDSNGNATSYALVSWKYLYSLYWSTLILTTVGNVPPPQTNWEFIFITIDYLLGVLIFATIVGMVGEIITNMNSRQTDFQSRLDSIKQYMGYRNVGNDLQLRIIKWFDYLWVNHHSLDEEQILQTLPDKLKAEIAIHVHFETLKKVQIFEECEAGLLEELVLKLKPQVFSPGDYICRKGDIGKEMYIIKHGSLEVVGDDGHTVLATLTDGSYFGEISILNLGGSGNRRTANVRSVGYSDLFCLSKADLLEALMEYPEAKALLEERGRRTLIRDGTLDESMVHSIAAPAVSSPTTARNASNVLTRRIDRLEADLEQLQGRFTRLLGEYNTAQMKLKQRIYTLESKKQT
eukprot:Em0022g419a